MSLLMFNSDSIFPSYIRVFWLVWSILSSCIVCRFLSTCYLNSHLFKIIQLPSLSFSLFVMARSNYGRVVTEIVTSTLLMIDSGTNYRLSLLVQLWKLISQFLKIQIVGFFLLINYKMSSIILKISAENFMGDMNFTS